MNDLNSAQAKLNDAVKRLEGAVDTLLSQTGDPVVAKSEMQALVEDRTRLAEELDAALARENELQKIADEASNTLESAIGEVRAALEQES